MRVLLLVIFIFLTRVAMVGQISEVQLTFDEFIKIVRNDHPVVYQAEMLQDMAAANARMARGGFDPKLEADWSHKSYDDKNYYALVSGAVKVPTWYGVELKAGYDRNNGEFVNQSDLIFSRGLWNAGISIGLGKGLVLDERRAALKSAEIYRQATVQDQIIMKNELLFDAADTYLYWQTAAAYLEIAIEGATLAELRFEGTKSSFRNGDKPAIDTLESFISLQARQLDEQKARQDLTNARLAINNFLWIQGQTPLELEEGAVPENLSVELLELPVESLFLRQELFLQSHPELLLYDYKLDQLDLDRRLAIEDLKPDLRVDYNPLVAVAQDALFDEFDPGDFKVGATLSYPLMQRKQRGKLRLIKLKEQHTRYDQAAKRQELSVKLQSYINNIRQAQSQYALLEETVQNYAAMLRGENRKLGIGESSIFLVNIREVKYLDSRYKMIEAGRKMIYNRLTYLLYLAQLDNTL